MHTFEIGFTHGDGTTVTQRVHGVTIVDALDLLLAMLVSNLLCVPDITIAGIRRL